MKKKPNELQSQSLIELQLIRARQEKSFGGLTKRCRENALIYL
jgi:hypothetical protein